MGTSTNTQHPNRPRVLMRVLLALLLGASLVFGPATTAHAADGVKMPNTVGMTAKTVRNLLRDEGFVVKLKPKSHGPVVMPSHWKITKQSPKAGTVIEPGDKIKLTVKLKKKYASKTKSPIATKTAKAGADETSAGLDGAHAATACDRYGDAQYPYGWKGHVFLGVIASEAQGDHYFFKFEADVTNAYDATASVTVDCTVGGSNDAPQVTTFDVY
ncbi:PASTA domain-containing protein [Curtobacterium flaccumfaciens]|uniref:PASTA domain-containing protein n=1 Tax=Curtobacterium flaccumfaciens TaxID=2035 RepID=UPI0011295BB0|nr:PASTA domain-containing protein [Curtobacterium flaccumfaciens]TPG05605.1 PASTA domain-containing protein [Curtobacterium flaccumfaciens]